MTSSKAFFPALILLAYSFSLSPAWAKGCLLYEPGVVSLKGVLQNRATLGGPKPDAEDGGGDRPIWVVDLDTVVCVEGKEKDLAGLYPTVDEVPSVQVILRKSDPPAKYESFLNKHVIVTGSLFHQSATWHIRKILILAGNIREDISKKEEPAKDKDAK